jgi:hypothetical protein
LVGARRAGGLTGEQKIFVKKPQQKKKKKKGKKEK